MSSSKLPVHNSKEDNDINQLDESKCDNCYENEFHYFCKECSEHLCSECNEDNHKRGERALHTRVEVFSREKNGNFISLYCKVHQKELRWFCKTCQHSICLQCFSQNGSHEEHDYVLCNTIADDLKNEVNTRYIEATKNKTEPILETVHQLETLLTEHASSVKSATTDVRAHFAAIRDLITAMEEAHIKQITDLAVKKTDTLRSHAQALQANLEQISHCSDVKESMDSPALELRASHNDVMDLLDDLESQMASVEITMDSSIPVTVFTSDVLRVLEKSCVVGTSSTLPSGEAPCQVASLRYTSDLDKNGLLYYIGSAGGTRPFANPHHSGEVTVTWSTTANDLDVNGWMMMDIGPCRSISPNHYILRYGKRHGGSLRNWVLEGKMDDLDTSAWVVLKEHVDDTSINEPGATCSWPLTSVDNNQSFRYIRIRITKIGNGNNGYRHLIAGIELYGDLFIRG